MPSAISPTISTSLPLAQRLRGVSSSPVRDLLALAARPEVISFAGGLPAPELFDVDGVRAAFDAVLAGPRARTALQYSTTEGDADLRSLLAARTSSRGLATTADDVLITTGSQQALALLSTALLDPGAVVAVEDPTYLAALQSFALAGARVVPVDSDDDGVVPASLERVLDEHSPALVYLVTTFANPTGRTLSVQRRAEVAAVLAGRPTWVVEDDPYGELRYRGEALAPLASQPGLEEQAIYLGSLSKVFAPGMRLGWLRAPRELRARLAVAKQASDLHTSTIDQAAAAAYLTATDLDVHVAGLRTAYGARRDAMLDALPSVLPPGSTWTDPDGGMFVWARLPDGLDASALLPVALEHDVAFVPGTPFYSGTPDRSTLRLSFTTHSPERTREGLSRLGRALRGTLAR
ncbi:2-aminoadipate transaminase [Quadrisphaera granulorum]|uniref:2-aminoadipate transaminase n=1 Tax=Quadrisphaera granulorum TaxID=317664 RepID=A0A316A7T7_9ACTN|nr:PLP-dependent aminotransferase family protein [Quadrisphaera granulorum]PWJ53775.1 2-aminoadipate transaminase [Quadrisphaera granulorum]SZE96532.1 2-aminoadipate transaminase [Quadrisphaera granulorum]